MLAGTIVNSILWAIMTIFPITDPNVGNLLMNGLTDIQREVINGAVTIDNGAVPDWIKGNFIRHGCGTFGNVANQDPALPNFLTHLFDCYVMGTKFRLENGQVTYTNRRYDTTEERIYSENGRNMSVSSVFAGTAFSKTNPDQIAKYKERMNNPTSVNSMPGVSWWKVGDKAVAMTEYPIGAVIDTDHVTHEGLIRYEDNNLGYPRGVIFTNNPAHQHEEGGTLWSVVTAVDMRSAPSIKLWRVVYKVGANRIRKVVGEYGLSNADLVRCSRTPPFTPYPDLGSRFGYMHSFSFTENYVILPETSYMFDPCFYARYDPAKPYFPYAFRDEKDGFSRIVVMRKSDGTVLANIKAKPFFVTHQLGSYEEGVLIHMDMLLYDNAEIYTKYTYVNSMLDESDTYPTQVVRITVDTRDWSVNFVNLRKGKPEAFEMSVINFAYNARRYRYAYMVKNFLKGSQNAITKLDVDTGLEKEYVLPMGVYAQEPQFVSRPNPTAEDDGVLLLQCVDANKDKALFIIIDAQTMVEIAHMTASDRALLGLHSRFFELDNVKH